MARAKYVEWFWLGAGTLRAVLRERGLEDRLSSREYWYLCPLCLDAMFTVEEPDTGEHVPPRRSAEFTATFNMYSAERARMSWIRFAYLSAFALFGWRYILTPTLQPIRNSLAGREGSRLPPIPFHCHDRDDDRRELSIVEELAECRSLLSVWGTEGIFLPLRLDSRGLDDLPRRVSGEAAGRVNFTFNGKKRPWLASPEHWLDPRPASEI
ncbi:hypothetical protein I6A84_26505 [Frankia sp. CNm7]|uniref:Uncharacterized protein n=1 Tax=Frankia nepalensis TaxID=1836974 RepID=A0A937URE2_9ACTN|nr:hypothetical protein [Frankia nepalensis]MBL7500983.1 hypothetical protein [Frankia nepalensis]MBL7512471.1 hypothetical protein [Frankia nepalensis]MBL7521537.1 hypothetical protein [Frankia nepalensis]MBL7632774.1 hypothetical protein [Frankia nepalensis]